MKTLHRTLTILCCFAAALFISWKLIHQVNYGYDFWYDNLDIPAHIAKFAPQNRQGKTGFEHTGQDQHTELFRAIGHAINNGGEGLRTLSYQPSAEASSKILLTDAEATHLEDVANLVDLLVPVGWAATGLLVALVLIALVAKIPLPGLGVSIITLIATAIIVALVIIIIGPREIFSGLHEAVFPDDNQWFFYYQDSLMTTLMKAPDIFAAISGMWAIVAVVVYLVITLLFRLQPKVRTESHLAR